MSKLRTALAATIAAALVLLLAAPAQAAPGDLTQKPGLAGCISEDGTGGLCADGEALYGATSVTVSPDGTSAYVASYSSNAVSVFDRVPDGTLTQKPGIAGCISEDGTGGLCADGSALDTAYSVTVSPDGTSAYVASYSSNAVAIFDRAPDGTLTQKAGTAGCISEGGSGGACTDGVALDSVRTVAVSPDGASVYVTSVTGGSVAVLDRAPNGTLTQRAGTAACISDDGSGGACADGVALSGAVSVTVSPDGTSVYSSSYSSRAVAVLDRAPDGALTQKAGTAGCISEDGTGGLCADGTAFGGAISVTVSPDGTSVYVGSDTSNAVAVLDRAPDGALTQKASPAACISYDGSGGACTDGEALSGVASVTVSPDGTSAYVASYASNAVTVFDRAPDGTLTQKTGTSACISEDGTGGLCADGTGLDSAFSVSTSPDGSNVYVASSNNAVAIFDRVRLPTPTPTPPPTPVVPGKPYLKLVGNAGRTSSRVRIGCGGKAACTIRLTGVRELNIKTGQPNGKIEARRSADRSFELAAGERKLTGVKYTKYLARTIKRALAAGNSVPPKLRITAKQAGHGFRTIGIRVGG